MMWLENAVNWMSDQDWSWWPFLSLRPAKDDDFTNARIATIAASFTPILAVFVCLVMKLSGRTLGIDVVAATLCASFVMLVVLLRLVAATAWNRRAARLRHARGAASVS